MTGRRGQQAVWVLALLGAALLAYGAYGLIEVGSCESNAPPGVRECPPEVLGHSVSLVAGIAATFVAIVRFGLGRAFGTAFLGIGAGVSAGAVTSGRLWALLLGLPFLVLGRVVADSTESSLPTRREELLREGRPGRVTVIDVREERGETARGTYRVHERVRVEPVGGEAYDSERTRVVETLPMIGERYAVLIDPADPHTWTEA